MKSRVAKPVKKTAAAQLPKTKQDWNRFMRRVISRAEAVGDRRLPGLKQALAQDRSETLLRKLSLVSQADIDREFSALKS
jgi:hypothetical protein